MSNLRNLIKEASAKKREASDFVASTIRTPKELNSFIEELAEQLSLSKQEMMLRFLEEGVAIAKDELNLNEDLNANEIESLENSKFYLLNSNKANSDTDQNMMLKEGVAAAFWGKWKLNIDYIKKGDVVFLYENSVGIIAFGYGTGNTLKKDHEGSPDECHYQKLENFTVLEKPISAREIKKILGRNNVVFLRTMSPIYDGHHILDKIQQPQ